MTVGLTSGTEFLRDCAVRYFNDHYHRPKINLGVPVDPKLSWVPTFNFNISSHLACLVEVSETPYPAILAMRRVDIMDMPIPISVYCVCPEQAYLSEQTEAKRLISHGFGLITVAESGDVQVRNSCIPLIQRIADEEFKMEIAKYSPSVKRRLVEAFDRYKHSPPSGAADISEVLEGFVLKAGQDAVKKGWVKLKDVRAGYSADTLDALAAAAQFKGATAPIGSVRGYISTWRNANHHFPKNKVQAATKYRECRHGFLDGLKKIGTFSTAMKASGLSGGLPSI